MQLVPGPDGSLEVVARIAADGVALEPEVAVEAEFAKHLEKCGLIVAATVQSLNELSPTASSFFCAGRYCLAKEVAWPR
ncbi:MAG: hypothetical protein H8E24_05535 [Verrucomicrobia bacterium]|jgi:hypothetical protein|nr:hypothetical protein [Verrucomicrobiota bacterium]